MGVCAYPGCGRKTLARGYCTGHYQQWYYNKPLHRLRHHRTFDMDDLQNMTIRTDGDCLIILGNTRTDMAITIDGERIPLKRAAYRLTHGDEGDCAWMDDICGNPYCLNPEHLTPHRSIEADEVPFDLNDQISEAEIRRFWSKVEKTSFCWNWIGYLSAGYGRFKMCGTAVCAHRMSFRLANGFILPCFGIDHICRNKRCVYPNHLRLATQSLNMQNQPNTAGNSSGHKNVYWNAKDQRWRVALIANGVSHYGGEFVLLDDAIEAAQRLRNKWYVYNECDRLTIGTA